jgi:hypothetical protein
MYSTQQLFEMDIAATTTAVTSNANRSSGKREGDISPQENENQRGKGAGGQKGGKETQGGGSGGGKKGSASGSGKQKESASASGTQKGGGG